MSLVVVDYTYLFGSINLHLCRKEEKRYWTSLYDVDVDCYIGTGKVNKIHQIRL